MLAVSCTISKRRVVPAIVVTVRSVPLMAILSPRAYTFHDWATVNGQLYHFATGGYGYHGPDMFHNTCKHSPSEVNGLTIGIAHGLHNGLGQSRMGMHRF